MKRRIKWPYLAIAAILLGVLVFATVSGITRVQAAPASQPVSAPHYGDGISNPVVVYADSISGSPVLIDLKPYVDRVTKWVEIPRRMLPNRDNEPLPQIDPVVQDTQIGDPNLPGPLLTWEGVNNRNGVLPPDTNGDVGPNHYVQTVNLSFAIWNKSGGLLYGPANTNTIWSGFGGVCQTSNDGDPIVLYDHLADRWLISQFALPNYPVGPYYQCIAISQTPDPTGAWWRYQFTVSNTKMNDYPHFGVWPDGYYMSVNQFTNGSSWGGQGVVVFERNQMLNGGTARMLYFDLYNTDPNLGGMLPSDLDGAAPPAGEPNYFVEMDDDAWGYSPDQLQIWKFHTDWNNTANTTFTKWGTLPTAAFDSDMCGGSRNCIPQPGGTALDAIADRLMYRLQYRNWGSYQTLVSNHTVDVNGSNRAGVRWYELRNNGGAWSIYQQGTYSPDATHRWMGSAAMDGLGNIALGYTVSSSSVYPGPKYTGRVPGDTLGTLPQGETTMFAGSGYQTHSSGRWGDYSMMAVDPVDDCTFWYTSEYYAAGASSAGWQTRIGSFRFPSCGGGGPTPTPTNTPTPGPNPTNTPTPTPTPQPTVTPTSTPTPQASSMHVGDLDGTKQAQTGGRWKTTITITVHNGSHSAVGSAKVTGSWSGSGVSGTSSCTTNSSGQCSVTKSRLSQSSNPSVTFTVTNVTKSGTTYQSGSNHDPDGDSNGTAITINKP